MKSIIKIILLFYTVFSFAQPTVTNTELLSATLSQITANTVDMTNLNVSPGPSGANVTWNFVPYTSTNSITTVNSSCPIATYCNQFPTATRIANVIDNNSYFDLNTNDLQILGSYNSISSDKVIYSNPQKLYQFPITYGQTFTDTYSYALQGSADVTAGTVTSEVDGYGTLLTAYGTIAGVLRIKKLNNYVVPNYIPGVPLNVNEEIYEWMDGFGQTFLVYRISTGTAPGVNYTLKSLVYTTNFVQLSTEENTLKNKISLFPNPAQDELNISSNEAIKEIQIFGNDGKLIKKINQNFEKIEVNSLTKGLYFLKITTNKEMYNEKFIKK